MCSESLKVTENDAVVTARVIGLDVWGHGPSDCAEHRCDRCVTVTEHADGSEDTIAHDDDRCDCHFDVNDRRVVGTIKLPADRDDDSIVRALVHAGYLASHVNTARKDVRVEEMGEDAYSIEDTETGEPLFQVEVES
jgi:hypothetical protein